MNLLCYVIFFLAAVFAIYALILAWGLATSAKVRCLFRTMHRNEEALGSQMYSDGPRFLYRCRDCGHTWTEPW